MLKYNIILEIWHLKGKEEDGRYCDELTGCEMAAASSESCSITGFDEHIRCSINDVQIMNSRKVK
jgi:hypothetical protein